jgi:hypothetical protein
VPSPPAASRANAEIRFVAGGQRGLAQVEHRRQDLLRHAVDAVQVAGVDVAANRDPHAVHAAVDGVGGDRIAEAVHAGRSQQPAVDLHPPVPDVLSRRGRRPHAQRLHDQAGGLAVAVERVVDDMQVHGQNR